MLLERNEMKKQDNSVVIITAVTDDEKKRILQKEFRDISARAIARYEEISKQVEYWIRRP